MTDSDADLAFGDLPQDPPALLELPALAAAVYEVRFAADLDGVSAEDASRVQAMLPYDLERVEPAEQHSINVNVGLEGIDPEASVLARGWQLSTLDRSTVFTMMSGVASIQVSKYTRWSESLRPLIEELLGALIDVFRPSLSQRAGLRYINRFAGGAETVPNDWIGKISDSVLGPITNPVLGPLVRGVHQELNLELEPGVGALIRHGILAAEPGHSAAYLVDLDVFVGRSAAFDRDALLHQATRLNRTANSLFRHTVTPGHLQDMRPSLIAEHTDEGDTP